MAVPEGGEPSAEATCVRGVKVLSWAFFGLFAGFGAAQALESSLNATLGFINLAALYTSFVIVGLFCSPVISSIVARCGWRTVFIMASVTYITMILANLDTARSNWVIQPIFSILNGAGGAFLWTTQNTYFGQCAHHAGIAAATAEGTDVQDAVKVKATQFNSSFFGVFQFSNTAGCLISSGLMLAFAGVAWVREVLYFALAGAAVCGASVFLMLPHIELSSDSQEEAPSISSAFKAIMDIKFVLLMPWIITNGMTYAFVNADFMADVVSPLLGSGYVGFMAAAFYFSDMVFTMSWGQFISKRCLSRRLTFMATTVFWAAFLSLKILWTREPNFKKDGDDWKRIDGAHVELLDVVLPLALCVLAGAGDAFWTPGPPAVLQSFFADSNLMGAMAAYKAIQSLGFAVQFTIGAVFGGDPTLRSLILLGCCTVSFVSVISLDSLKQSLDPRTPALVEASPCEREYE